MIRRSVCPYISQSPFLYHIRIVRAARPANYHPHVRCALDVLSPLTPMGGDHNTHRELPPPHQPGAWNMIPTTTTKEGT